MNETKPSTRVIAPVNFVVSREVQGEIVVVDLNSGIYHTFNQVGSAIWREIMRGATAASIARTIASTHLVSEQQAAVDIDSFLQELLRRKLVE